MTLETAIRATEILLAFAFVLQSLEHLSGPSAERFLFSIRLLLALVLLSGIASLIASLGLLFISLAILRHFQGPYNGGSDRMGLLIVFCLALALSFPSFAEIAFGYLALQVLLSYLISGAVKVANPDWRTGRALRDVFLFSAYPVSEDLRFLAERKALMFWASWAVMLLELLFPLAFLGSLTLITALTFAAIFHLVNAVLLGLNRFFWIWLSAYPSLLWLQDRVFQGTNTILP